ncbi:uncharacterized protein DSM5745_06462 [Aspergillus mulundensis]|uniref:Uncharacterized protein n=1 Tax=Aspergillus mulundensis TaxID=1810919 RepID=A0A3D8RR82_9EURO|nr:hypothetical protein DSM5745_06462 [Aspergillus mulundensis]RDW76470.1 hypothetical protein DSM5745_06462 [Aspergillus mulundensis]
MSPTQVYCGPQRTQTSRARPPWSSRHRHLRPLYAASPGVGSRALDRSTPSPGVLLSCKVKEGVVEYIPIDLWGGFEKNKQAVDAFSSAHLNATFEEFCALTPACGNEAFNIANGDFATWSSVLPAVAAHFNTPMAPLDALNKPGPHPVKKVSKPPTSSEPARTHCLRAAE